jgi:hypothetical protein
LVEIEEYATYADSQFGLFPTKIIRNTFDAGNQWISETVDRDGPSEVGGPGGQGPIERTFYLWDQGQIVLDFRQENAGNDLANLTAAKTDTLAQLPQLST